jgi:hypothetical protein
MIQQFSCGLKRFAGRFGPHVPLRQTRARDLRAKRYVCPDSQFARHSGEKRRDASSFLNARISVPEFFVCRKDSLNCFMLAVLISRTIHLHLFAAGVMDVIDAVDIAQGEAK